MDTVEPVPPWLVRPLPTNAHRDEKLVALIAQLCADLPANLRRLTQELDKVQPYVEYDVVANLACASVWRALDSCSTTPEPTLRIALLRFAEAHMGAEALSRICRRLALDPATHVRRSAQRVVERSYLREVALPLEPEGDWDPSGWFRAGAVGPLTRHKQGRRILARHGLPELPNLAALRQLLDIRSPKQLGFFLLASDKDDGPYTRFSLAKRDGGERVICAPKKQLRWVQRQLLDKILARLPAHGTAHGFVPGRSTVTNATHHRGAALLLKFDLTDFFPTIHYFRVLGLFTSLGYFVGDGKFGTADQSAQVAPVLARLCCYTPEPRAWGNANLPQGAPTSPAISNLVCRRLDARLEGLARRNQGVYTRYADDLTFSFRSTALEVGRFRWWVDQICQQEGFWVNQKKFHVIRSSQRQLVTGIVVNDDLRVPREERRRFRAILHNCRTQGLATQARGQPGFADYLRGFASYVNMVQPEEGAELLRQVNELLGPDVPAEDGP